MSTPARTLSFSLAINEALHQTMEQDSSVLLIGQGVKSPWYVGNTATGLLERFGTERVVDTPISENAMTGLTVGAAIAGMRPIAVHPRMDFMLYAFDPIINEAANWHYMSGGAMSVPVVFWGIINRGGEQAAQHSQAFHSLFAHIPGLKVVAPATPYDAKGLMVAAIQDNDPVVFIDERWLYSQVDIVPESLYSVPIGKAAVRREGRDLTVVASSYMSLLAHQAAEKLAESNIQIELVDLRTIKPWDKETVFSSVRKTGRLLVLDGSWNTCGLAGEIISSVTENEFTALKSAPARITLPDCPAPAARTLEKAYYPDTDTIITVARDLVKKPK